MGETPGWGRVLLLQFSQFKAYILQANTTEQSNFVLVIIFTRQNEYLCLSKEGKVL